MGGPGVDTSAMRTKEPTKTEKFSRRRLDEGCTLLLEPSFPKELQKKARERVREDERGRPPSWGQDPHRSLGFHSKG